jgi:hypothetical protein
MTVMAFYPSEQFWLEQRVDQIDEKSRGHERSERIVKDHDPISSELFAAVHIGDRQREEADRERHHHEVHHANAPDEILPLSRCPVAGSDFDFDQDGAKNSCPLRRNICA